MSDWWTIVWFHVMVFVFVHHQVVVPCLHSEEKEWPHTLLLHRPMLLYHLSVVLEHDNGYPILLESQTSFLPLVYWHCCCWKSIWYVVVQEIYQRRDYDVQNMDLCVDWLFHRVSSDHEITVNDSHQMLFPTQPTSEVDGRSRQKHWFYWQSVMMKKKMTSVML